MSQENIQEYIVSIAQKAKSTTRVLSSASTQQKNNFLYTLAQLLDANTQNILSENSKDINLALENNMDEPRVNRLRLTEQAIADMVEACQFVAQLEDPIGSIHNQIKRPNGLLVGKMSIPLGVIAMIYESRPNVTIDAAILCLKTGNAIILRGGSEAYHSNKILASLLQQALKEAGLPEDCVQFVNNTHRESIFELCKLHQYIDIIIPRGGEKMIQSISAHATMPVLKHDKGVPHAFIDESADIDMAVNIIINAKTQRPGVCNALEGLLIHKTIAPQLLAKLAQKTENSPLWYYACEQSLPVLTKNASPLQEEHKGYEFLDLKLVVKVVDDMDEALDYIHNYGSNHTEIICTNNYSNAQRFLREADASMVAVNASTRFNDGSQLGLGAEIGICTSKLHAYGPMGIKELTTTKFVVFGDGQVRQ